MEHKFKTFEVKSAGDAGKITGYFATYDRIPDSYGDIIAPGAFTETIQKRKESGHPFPLCWNHDLNQIIGMVEDIEDTEKGPLMTASFFDTQLAQEKRELVKSGVVYQFSFAYDIIDAAGIELEDGTKAYELRKLKLFEVSIVPIPANPRAEMTDIKAGRRNSQKDADAIREAIKLLQGVLGELDDAEDPEDGEDLGKSNAAAEETEPSNPKKDQLLEYIKTIKRSKTMTLKEQLKAKKDALAELKARIEKDDEEAIKAGEALHQEIVSLEADIQKAEKKAALLGVIGEKKEENPMAEPIKAKSLGENFVEHLKSNNVGARFDITAPEYVKTYSDVQKTPSTSGVSDFATTYDRAVVEAARVPLVVRDLFAAETISGSTLVFLKEGAIEGAPAVTAEGVAKPQVHFADPTPVTVSLAKVACFIKESDEYINDYPFLASAINGRLLYQLGLVEQNKLVTDLLGTSGIQSDTTSWISTSTATDIADLILDAAMDVQNSSGFAADAIVMNPTDWYNLRVAKDGEDRYYGGGFFGAQNIPNLWGIPVCVTTAVAAGTIVVGAFKTCGSVVGNGGVRVEAVNTDQDDFVKNLMTIRAEERLALAVRRPAGFKKIVKVA